MLKSSRGRALGATIETLLAERAEAGNWDGELSTSALATATAVVALGLAARAGHAAGEHTRLAAAGIRWLIDHQNDDGGWGDTTDSPSNPSTTTLCWAALGLVNDDGAPHTDFEGPGIAGRESTGIVGPKSPGIIELAEPELNRSRRAGARAETWLRAAAGGLSAARLGRLIDERYGADKTFSVPILTLCALSGRFGAGRSAWDAIPSIPFELAALPRGLFSRIGLPMVSYALPALIAVGQARHRGRPTRNPITRCARTLARRRTLRILESLQPTTGGFIEAIPLTSFVVMSLLGAGEGRHPVVERGLAFLRRRVRADGGWPIDTDLATWVTTLSINAIAAGGEPSDHLSGAEIDRLRAWLLEQQYRVAHPYTDAAPGGWAWTPCSGGVPDADDTPGALLALRNLGRAAGNVDAASQSAAAAGVGWLLGLQNRDGGIPTFCRGWTKLPFDRSSPDLTAHTLRAWGAWRGALPADLDRRLPRATGAAVSYLVDSQRPDGAWVPLWFGNQSQAAQQNPLYGTTRVLRAQRSIVAAEAASTPWKEARRRAEQWLLSAQRADGGFGADRTVEPSIEETALAVDTLADLAIDAPDDGRLRDAMERACGWLIEATDAGRRFPAAPIGLYFAKLWYSERLYPVIFTASALGRATRLEALPRSGRTTSSP